MIPIPTEDYLSHGGKGSGRYPLGSGLRPYQHSGLIRLSDHYKHKAEKYENKNKRNAESQKAQYKSAKYRDKANKELSKHTLGLSLEKRTQRRVRRQMKAERYLQKAERLSGNNPNWSRKARKYRKREEKINRYIDKHF